MITATATLQSVISVTAQIVSKEIGNCADATVQLNGSTIGTIASGDTDSFPVTQDGYPRRFTCWKLEWFGMDNTPRILSKCCFSNKRQ